MVLKKTDLTTLQALVKCEMSATEDPNVLFRGNTLTTKCIDYYMKLYGLTFLQSTFADLVENVYRNKDNCEIDEAKLEKSEDARKNGKKLLSYVNQFWDAIVHSVDRFPNELKYLFSCVQQTAFDIYEKENLRYLSVSGFMFLRFFCPAILNPKMFGIVDEHPEGNVARTLTLIAKSLQNLANMVEFGAKEPHMGFMNQFILKNTEKLKETIMKFSSAKENCVPTEMSLRIPDNLGRVVASIVSFLSSQFETFEKLEGMEDLSKVLTNLRQEILACELEYNRYKEEISVDMKSMLKDSMSESGSPQLRFRKKGGLNLSRDSMRISLFKFGRNNSNSSYQLLSSLAARNPSSRPRASVAETPKSIGFSLSDIKISSSALSLSDLVENN